jgi:hypothetical protein
MATQGRHGNRTTMLTQEQFRCILHDAELLRRTIALILGRCELATTVGARNARSFQYRHARPSGRGTVVLSMLA